VELESAKRDWGEGSESGDAFEGYIEANCFSSVHGMLWRKAFVVGGSGCVDQDPKVVMGSASEVDLSGRKK
jgi:hypothetical protein